MKQNTTLLLSLGITVFVLVIIAGVMNPQIVLGKSSANDQQAAVDQQVQQALAEREAAYNQLLMEANQRLEAANQQIETMSQEVQQVQAAQEQQSQAQPSGSQYIPVEAAQQAAQAVVQDASLTKAPELVDFEGKVAYEVGFDKGNVYVDASSGEVLMNGTVAEPPHEVTKEEAIKIAQDYMGLTDIYLADMVTISGQQLWRVIFNAGHFVYMDKTGQITIVQMYNPSVNPDTAQASYSGGGGGGGGHHEDDDHEGHGDD